MKIRYLLLAVGSAALFLTIKKHSTTPVDERGRSAVSETRIQPKNQPRKLKTQIVAMPKAQATTESNSRSKSGILMIDQPAVSAEHSSHDSSLDSLNDIAFLPTPNGALVAQVVEKNGNIGTAEIFDDGPMVYKTFSPNGALLGESINFGDGQRLDRAYDLNGNLSGVSWSQDGYRIDAKYTSAGVITGRTDYTPDGDRIVTKFDNAGQPVGEWKSLPDGQWEKI